MVFPDGQTYHQCPFDVNDSILSRDVEDSVDVVRVVRERDSTTLATIFESLHNRRSIVCSIGATVGNNALQGTNRGDCKSQDGDADPQGIRGPGRGAAEACHGFGAAICLIEEE